MRMRLVLAVLAVSTLFVLPADAQTELDRARTQVAEATEQLEEFLAELESTQRRGDELAAQFWQVQSGLERLDLNIAATEEVRNTLAAERGGLVDQVRELALDQYIAQTDPFPGVEFVDEADRAAAEALADVVIGTDKSAIDQLAALDARQAETADKLQAQRDEQAAALAELAQTQSSLADELDRLANLRASLDRELVELEDGLADLEALEAERQAAVEAAAIAEERRRAEAAAAAAAARAIPTPAPPLPTSVPTPTVAPTATAVPNPQLPDATPTPAATAVPNPQLPDATPTPAATAVPNPQLPDPTPVPNPQPSTNTGSSGGAGGIVCPLAGPFTHTDDFNAPRAVGGVHRANDLISAQGTPVIAVASGTLQHKDSSVGGLSAHLRGDNGNYYFYTHLSGYENVGAGHVPAGTVIGYVGMTGNAPIPHLHFEIHLGGYGNYSNPYGPVRAACF